MLSLTLLLRSIILNLYIVRYSPYVFTNNTFCEIHSIILYYIKPFLHHYSFTCLPCLPACSSWAITCQPPCIVPSMNTMSASSTNHQWTSWTTWFHLARLVQRNLIPPPFMPVTHTSRSPRSLLPPHRMMATHSQITSISHPHAISQITTLDRATSEPPPHNSPWNS